MSSESESPDLDGEDLSREILACTVQLYLNPQAEHLLDWFHLTMRLIVLNQIAKGLPERIGEGEDQYELRTGVFKDLERIKWYLWHGNVFQALNELQSLEMDLDAAAFESKDESSQKLLKSIEELHTYVERNQEFVPNYGERYRNGEKIASGFVESAINQVVSKRMVKKQQMGSRRRGAHLLLQIRTRVLDEEWKNTFRRWYPDFPPSSASQESGLTPRESPALLKFRFVCGPHFTKYVTVIATLFGDYLSDRPSCADPLKHVEVIIEISFDQLDDYPRF